ncbi:ArsR/SmtB family transcription factor [Silvibacterium dinghuense]|uniref:ArsR family transcriptional regulator n=1 Tax=Silvibacterium dinghuense TaxID=1560006 RepID=A0A4Q1SJ35_9BACT|nr:metalloregulator ArsR/SmtB family transcription factor [Silvibacterium dinghuense]RXS97270.1 ArsR family transcriptional regulator [Silvibacterium dinghuense]GGG97674.1 hypothetical protein GCM10011586_11170 [Silvibacterium dinghuense]
MSPRTPDRSASGAGTARRLIAPATLFAALGDETRLALLDRLVCGEPRSITDLADGLPQTRQAISKHLRVLQRAKMVRCTRRGRESLFSLEPAPLMTLQAYLQRVSTQWDAALVRLQELVESDVPPLQTPHTKKDPGRSPGRQ